jgi:diaminohydroxyphosphoribosylaminopyrimidine deaminase/5-amino-6-(5-phosphoribosylamino)uracil reductase
MGLALRLAERGRGQTSPNPMVGAVVVTPQDVVVGLGYHRKAGEPHAEILALHQAGARAHGATLYCTLEPCAHVGRTGPCCVAVRDAGVARVVAAAQDPNPQVAGRGLAFLRRAGVDVTSGVLLEEATRQNVAFFTAMRRGRPWVVLKVATSLDCRVSAAPGERTALTGAEANRAAHRFRAEVDAIGVGSETVLVDNPRLTVRGVYRERPLVRVIFDTRLRTPPDAVVLRTGGQGPVVIMTTEAACDAAPDRVETLRAAGAEIVMGPSRDLAAALRLLGMRDVRSLLIEGGPTLHQAAWRCDAVDRVQVFVSPRLLGPQGVAWELAPGFSVATLANPRVTPLGADVLLEGDVHGPD